MEAGVAGAGRRAGTASFGVPFPTRNEWNKTEHQMFSQITHDWRGRLLVCWEVVVNLIGAVTTQQGLRIQSELEENNYESGKMVTDEEMQHPAIFTRCCLSLGRIEGLPPAYTGL